MPEPYDLIVIGAGPGGYVAAIRAAQLGLKTAVVEREHLGGICLNWGCIPTKALLRSADVFRLARAAGDYGLAVAAPGFDIAKIVARSREVAGKLNAGVEFLLKKNKVDVIFGQALLKGAGVGGGFADPKAGGDPASAQAQGRAGAGRLQRQEYHRRHRRAAARVAGNGARRAADLDLFRGAEAR